MADLVEYRRGNNVYRLPASMSEEEATALIEKEESQSMGQDNAQFNTPNRQNLAQNSLRNTTDDPNANLVNALRNKDPRSIKYGVGDQTTQQTTQNFDLKGLGQRLHNRDVYGAMGGTLASIPTAIAGNIPPFTATPEELITIPAAYAGGDVAGKKIFDTIEQLRGNKTPPESLKKSLADTGKDLYSSAKWSYAFGGLPVIGGAIRRGLVGDKTNAKELVEHGKNIGLRLGIGEVTTKPIVKGFSRVIGVFPWLGRPLVKKGDITQKTLEKTGDDILNAFGPNQNLADLGVDIFEAAKNSYKEFRTLAKTAYTKFNTLAGQLKTKDIIKLTNTHQYIKNLKDKVTTFRLGGGQQRTIEGYKDPIMPLFNKIMKIKGNIKAEQYRHLQKEINRMMQRGKKEGWDIARLGRLKSAMEKDFTNLAKPKNLSAQDAVLWNQVVEAHQSANSIYSQGMKLFSSKSAKHFERVDKNIFNAGFSKQGNVNADELVPIVMKMNSPEGIKSLKTLIGKDLFRKSAQTWIDRIFQDGTRFIKNETTLKYDAKFIAKELGMFGKNKARTESVKQLFKEAGVSYRKLNSFLKLASNYETLFIPKVSSFMARRATLGGVSSLGIGGSIVATFGGWIPFSLSVLGARHISKLVSNPKVLDDALFLMQGKGNQMRKYMVTHQLLNYLIGEPDVSKEDKEAFNTIKNTIQDEMNNLNLKKINRR